MNNIMVLVSIATQQKLTNGWITTNITTEKWTLKQVNEYFSDENIKAWKNASNQKLTKNYTSYGYLPTKYTNTEKIYKELRKEYELDYITLNR